MITRFCDGCRTVIAPSAVAARDVQLPDGAVDWCDRCVVLVRAHLPRLADEARECREALRDTARVHVRHRALRIWGPDSVPEPASRAGA